LAPPPRQLGQVAGHKDSFMEGGDQRTILKKYDRQEEESYKDLMADVLKVVVPKFYRTVNVEGERFLELCCCLSDFDNPDIMDIKMGQITFAQSEASLMKQRSDLYMRMVDEDPDSTSTEENNNKAVSKLRLARPKIFLENSWVQSGGNLPR